MSFFSSAAFVAREDFLPGGTPITDSVAVIREVTSKLVVAEIIQSDEPLEQGGGHWVFEAGRIPREKDGALTVSITYFGGQDFPLHPEDPSCEEQVRIILVFRECQTAGDAIDDEDEAKGGLLPMMRRIFGPSCSLEFVVY